MFTGIIEELGRIISLSSSIKIAAKKVTEDIHIGDSIAVNGICLTVTEFTADTFTVDVMPETVRRTSLNTLKNGSYVHLERAMPANGRFGGHIVSGHIDGTGCVSSLKKDGNAMLLSISAADELLKFIAPKGSVTLDGVSLTVVNVYKGGFTVSLIPHTSSVTTLTEHKTGDIINIEVDVLAKYLEHMINFDKSKSTLDMDLLTRCGF